MEEIENKMEELKNGKITRMDLGIETESIIAEAGCLSMGEMIAVEEELNKLNTSMYEDVYMSKYDDEKYDV